eukprot:EG_transcript_7299
MALVLPWLLLMAAGAPRAAASPRVLPADVPLAQRVHLARFDRFRMGPQQDATASERQVARTSAASAQAPLLDMVSFQVPHPSYEWLPILLAPLASIALYIRHKLRTPQQECTPLEWTTVHISSTAPQGGRRDEKHQAAKNVNLDVDDAEDDDDPDGEEEEEDAEEEEEDEEDAASKDRWVQDQFLRVPLEEEETPSIAQWDDAVASQWHPSRNPGLLPDKVLISHDQPVWWRCAEGPRHEWQATPKDRATRGAGCPFCGVLGTAPQRYHTVENFYPRAKELRGVFDARFGNTRGLSPKRFCWDHWHVPEQYSFHRTLAEEYFSDLADLGQENGEWEALKEALLDYGTTQLGCAAITPLWLSYYCDGDEQQWHCDVPHGAYAFVLSLTDWDRRTFSGGDTALLRDDTMSHWSRFFDIYRDDPRHPAQAGLNYPDLVEHIPARFNQLLVFDGRIPHGVRRVYGARDPREARLVLHGWFSSPEPFYDGALQAEEVEPPLRAVLDPLMERLADYETYPQLHGHLAIQLVAPGAGGPAQHVRVLTESLRLHPSEEDPARARNTVARAVLEALRRCVFPAAPDGTDTRIVLPLSFE